MGTYIMSDAVYEDLYDAYLSFRAIQGLVSAIPSKNSDFPAEAMAACSTTGNDISQIKYRVKAVDDGTNRAFKS